jgi:4-alpha-glucanotransferase
MIFKDDLGSRAASLLPGVKPVPEFKSFPIEKPYLGKKEGGRPMLSSRGSGILLHVSSLPSPFGIGDLGEGAYRFVDFLIEAGQNFWQILPNHFTVPYYGHSPYMSISAFAGNPLFISPELLFQKGLLRRTDLETPSPFPEGYVDYSRVTAFKEKILTIAWRRFTERPQKDMGRQWERFCSDNDDWLSDFALFIALRTRFHRQNWSDWPRGIRDRRMDDLRSAEKELSKEIKREKFRQFLFFNQWESLKKYCNDRKILIIGDMPLYVGHDSADVWSHPVLFHLDKKKKPSVVSGVPPDSYGKTGQLWGHPLYRWNELKKTGYDWMIRRMTHHLKRSDVVRIDHFRGFVNYWEVPAAEKTAMRGRWVEAPAVDFFTHLIARIPEPSIICEDLGVSPPDFRQVMVRFKFPGMKVLLFAFGKDLPGNPHAPHHHRANSVVYTGTHDNNTIRGWYTKDATSRDRLRLSRYLGKKISLRELHWDVMRLAMMSVAGIAIFPMQDILGLGEEARMNHPGTVTGNWTWRLPAGHLTPHLARRLMKMTTLYGRSGQSKGGG